MIPTDYKDINVNYVYLKNAMKINLTLMKNHTYWGLLRVSHSATLIFTLVAPPFPPEAYYSMVTGFHIIYLVKLGYHLEWVWSSALPKAHTEGTLQTITHTKLRNHSFIATVKGTGNRHRGWLWSGAPGGGLLCRLSTDNFTPHPLPPLRRQRLHQGYVHFHPILQTALNAEYLGPNTGAAEQDGPNVKRVQLHPGPASDG